MEFKNTGTITKIIYNLNKRKYSNKITIKLDNHNDEEKNKYYIFKQCFTKPK